MVLGIYSSDQGTPKGIKVMGKDSTVVTVLSEIEDDKPKRNACLVVISGADLGKRYILDKTSTMIGRSRKVDIYVDEDAISRNHAVVDNFAGTIVARDLESTNGTFVNDISVKEKELKDGDQIKIGRTIFKFLSGSNVESQYHDEIYQLTIIDGLTQAFNKRFFLKELEREMSRSARYDRRLSLCMMDIDFFKSINDRYGHLAGDHVLRQVSKLISAHIRRDDFFARYGGEEFALILPEISRLEAMRLAEKIRSLVENEPFEFDNVVIPITISIGVSDLAEYSVVNDRFGEDLLKNIDPFALIKLADDRLFEAKRLGRNKVISI